MAPDWDFEGNGSEDEEDDVQDEIYHSSDATLFLVEATPSMLEPMTPPSSDMPVPSTQQRVKLGWTGKPASTKMELCLRCAYAMMRRKALSAPRDRIGIIIFNTAKTEGVPGGNDAKKHCTIVQDLTLVTADSLRRMKDLLADIEDDSELVSKKFEVNTATNALTDAMQGCTDVFRKNASSNRINKKIILLTDNDEPYPPKSKLRNPALERRKDVADMDHKIEPFFFSPPDHEFDVENFYGKFITMAKDDEYDNDDDDGDMDENEIPIAWPTVHRDIEQTLSEIVENLRTKEAMKRTQFQIPFTLAQGTTIGVKGFALVGVERLRLPTKVDLNTSHADAVIHKIYYKDQVTGEDIDVKTEVRKYFQVGRPNIEKGAQPAQVFFTEQEVRKVKTLKRSPSMSLLGFVTRFEFLKFEETIKHGYFLRPDEDAYSGSTRTFTALMESMLKKQVIGYASLLSRVSGRPQIVILDAQEETLDKDTGVVERPAGIHVYQLPFVDDLRRLRLGSTPSVKISKPRNADGDDGGEEPDQPVINVATAIVKKLIKKYDPDLYPNPALNFFYETLAATALDDDLPDPIDKTVPAYETIRARVGDKIKQLKELINEDELDPSLVKTSSRKRPLSPEPIGSEQEMREFADALTQLQNKMTVPQLKDGLKVLGQPQSGTKAVLIERATAALTDRGLWASPDTGTATKKKKKRGVIDDDE